LNVAVAVRFGECFAVSIPAEVARQSPHRPGQGSPGLVRTRHSCYGQKRTTTIGHHSEKWNSQRKKNAALQGLGRAIEAGDQLGKPEAIPLQSRLQGKSRIRRHVFNTLSSTP